MPTGSMERMGWDEPTPAQSGGDDGRDAVAARRRSQKRATACLPAAREGESVGATGAGLVEG